MNVDISVDMYEYVINGSKVYAICRLKQEKYREHFRHDTLRIEVVCGYKKSSNEVITRAYEMTVIKPVIELKSLCIPIQTFTKETINERSKRYLTEDELAELEKGKKACVYAKLYWVKEIARILKVLNSAELEIVIDEDITDLLSSLTIFGCKTEIAPIILLLKENPSFFGILAPSILMY